MSVEAGWQELTIASLFDSSRPGEWGADGTRDTGTPVLRSTNFCDDGSIDYSDIAYRTVPESRLAARRIGVGTILIEKAGGSSTRPAGRVVYCDREFGGTASNFVEVIKVGETLSPKYVFYLLYNNFHSGLVYKYQQQTTGIINFKLREYGSEVVSIPESRTEQSKIAEVLSTVDRAIAQTEALIAKQQRIKTGLMQDLLTRGIDEHGQLRSEATHAFKDSPLGRIPVQWDVCVLERAVRPDSPITYGVVQPGKEDEYGVLFVRGGDIYQGEIGISKLRTISKAVSAPYRRTLLRGGELLMSLVGYPGEVAVVPESLAGANIARQAALIRLSNHFVPAFVMCYLLSPDGKRQVLGSSLGSAQQVVNLKDLRTVVVPMPSVEEQIAIAERFAEVFSQQREAMRALEKLRSLKTALMQDLLTGKVRVTPLLQAAEVEGHG